MRRVFVNLMCVATTLGVLAAEPVSAAVMYWDTSTDGGIQAGDGTWNNNSATFWSNSTAGSNPLLAWTNTSDNANFYSSGASAVNVSETINMGGMSINGAGYSFGGVGKLRIGGNGLTVNESTTIDTNIGLRTATSWTVAADKTLAIGTRTGTRAIADYALAINGAGTITSTDLRFRNNAAVTQSAGTVTSTGWIMVGDTSTATYTIDGGTLSAPTNQIYVGFGAAGNGTITQNGGDVITDGGLIIGSGAGVTGVYNLNGGTLTVDQFGGWGASGGSYTFNCNGGTLKFTESDTNAYNLKVKSGGAKIDTNWQNVTLGGALQEDSGSTGGGLQKLGGGRLELTGSSTYTGATTINGGSLKISGSGDINATSGVIVNGDGTRLLVSSSTPLTKDVTVTQGGLGGTGTINGSISLTSQSLLTPGDATGEIGTLTIGSVLALAGSTRMDIDKNPIVSADLLDLGENALTFGGELEVVGNNVENYSAGDIFTLFSAASFSGAFGSFVLPTLAEGLLWDTSHLAIDGSLRVGEVPEPSAIAILVTGLIGLAIYAWRIRK